MSRLHALASRPHAPAPPRRSSSVTIPPRPAASPLAPTIARWPLDLEGELEAGSNHPDAAIAIVRRSLIDYRTGRADQASRAWADDIVWTCKGVPPVGGEWKGAEGVFSHHARLERLSGGTFRQRLVALEGCRGSTVTAYLRTTASRNGRELDIPSLAVFELTGGLVRRVTELPGDQAAWDAFWAD